MHDGRSISGKQARAIADSELPHCGGQSTPRIADELRAEANELAECLRLAVTELEVFERLFSTGSSHKDRYLTALAKWKG